MALLPIPSNESECIAQRRRGYESQLLMGSLTKSFTGAHSTTKTRKEGTQGGGEEEERRRKGCQESGIGIAALLFRS